jgi:hypothetical protein
VAAALNKVTGRSLAATRIKGTWVMRKKTFREKLADSKDLPRVEPIPEGMRK